MTWTILTGAALRRNPLDIRVRYNVLRPARITITAEYWISPKVIEREWRKTQQQLRGKDNHPLSLRSLAVLRFVEDQSRTEGKRPSWRELLKRWNLKHPKWHCKDVRNFKRTYDRALDEVAHPSVRLVGRRLSPEERRRRQQQIEEARAREERIKKALERLAEETGNADLFEARPSHEDN